MQQLSKSQINLIECLKYLGLRVEAVKIIMLLIRNDYEIASLANFLINNQDATENQIIKKAIEISEAK